MIVSQLQDWSAADYCKTPMEKLKGPEARCQRRITQSEWRKRRRHWHDLAHDHGMMKPEGARAVDGPTNHQGARRRPNSE